MPWYGERREPLVNGFLPVGSRTSQHIVFIRFLMVLRWFFMQTQDGIARFAQAPEKTIAWQGVTCEGIRPPAMAGVD